MKIPNYPVFGPKNWTIGQLTDLKRIWDDIVRSFNSTPSTIQVVSLSGVPPFDSLGPADIGLLIFVTTYGHFCRWDGDEWIIADGGGGYFVDSAIPLGEGYKLCDGSATTYLTTSGGDLTTAAFTTPDTTTAPSGIYHKSIAAYTGTINAATPPGISGATGDTDLNPTTRDVEDGVITPVTVIDGFDNPHSHGVGTLAVDATGQPRNLGVLRYFRR